LTKLHETHFDLPFCGSTRLNRLFYNYTNVFITYSNLPRETRSSKFTLISSKRATEAKENKGSPSFNLQKFRPLLHFISLIFTFASKTAMVDDVEMVDDSPIVESHNLNGIIDEPMEGKEISSALGADFYGITARLCAFS
jgi:hypothetical protein